MSPHHKHLPSKQSCDVIHPKQISLAERIIHTVLSVGFIGFGLLTDDLYLPGKRRGAGTHLHGTPALLMFIAMCCAAAALLL